MNKKKMAGFIVKSQRAVSAKSSPLLIAANLWEVKTKAIKLKRTWAQEEVQMHLLYLSMMEMILQ